ncbi:MAG: alanine racemase [Rhodothermales bacterium]
MQISDLPTPCILVEKSRLASNLQRMQEKAHANNVQLRPHTKTHKSVTLAKKQQAQGAVGLTVAKVGEAEVFMREGFKDIRIAYNVIGDEKYARLLALMQKGRVSFCVDTLEGAQNASRFFDGAGVEAEVLIEVDCGYGRCGVRWDQAQSVTFAEAVSNLPGLKLVGILTHAGNSYGGPTLENETLDDSLKRVSAEERDRMLAFAIRLHRAGVQEVQPNAEAGGFEISIGSTPSMKHFENNVQDGFTITEIRPGNYPFNDAIQEALSVASLQDCALTVYATVVSKQRNSDGSERLFLDAGRKVFTGDTGYQTDGFGIIMYNTRAMHALPHAKITGLSEEHGWVTVPGASTLEVGNTVRVVPNHACVVVNNLEVFHIVDGHEVVASYVVDARGRVS